ncbi:ABC transporter permease [Chloroflexota bacterium]
MQAYIIRRLLLIIPTVFLLTIIVFLLVRFIPGDVIDVIEAEMAEAEMGAVDRAAIAAALGLDVPVHVQYGRWIGVLPIPDKGFSGILQGDLGTSLRRQQSVTEEIFHRMPITFELSLLAMIIGASVSLPIGIYSAIRQDTMGDYGGRTVAILCISIPNFWVGTLIMVYPSIWWGWAPPMEVIPLFEDPIGNLGMFIIPAIVMGLMLTGASMRITRTMMLEVLRQDYIRTAWAKGLGERVIVLRHALRNALIPVVTVIGLQVPLLIGGSVIIEQIFCLPGLGRLMLESLSQRDYPMISGINLVMGVFVLFANLGIDTTYAYLDPRVHYK